MQSWQALDAERNFGRLVDAAQKEPQVVLRQSDPIGILMSVDHYDRLKRQADTEFARLLMSSPLEESDFDRSLGTNLTDG